jgi:hypothetical protein
MRQIQANVSLVGDESCFGELQTLTTTTGVIADVMST